MTQKMLEKIMRNGGRYEDRNYMYAIEERVTVINGEFRSCYLLIRASKRLDGSGKFYWLGERELIALYDENMNRVKKF